MFIPKATLDWFANASDGAKEDLASDLRKVSKYLLVWAVIACPWLPLDSVVVALLNLGVGEVLAQSVVQLGGSGAAFVISLVLSAALRALAFLVRYK